MARLTDLREQMGVMQHHDAVTGTEKQHVANDYVRTMYRALEGCNENARLILNEFTKPTSGLAAGSFEFESCHYLNISQCHISDAGSDRFMVTVYNPLAHSTFQAVRIPVLHQNYVVRDYRKSPVEVQVVAVNERVRAMPSRSSNASFEIVFLAQDIPGLGYKSYFVEKATESEGDRRVSERQPQESPPKRMRRSANLFTIGNQNVQATFNKKTGLLETIFVNGETHNVSQEFMYYHGASGHNYNYDLRSSGAYIFRPNGSEIRLDANPEIRFVRGSVVDEAHQQFNEWISQVVRIYHDNSTNVEFEWMVGPIPVDDMVGKEIITRFSSEIQSQGVFYTDSNAREMIRRVREVLPMHKEEVIAQNYYPLNSKIYLEDDTKRMAILTDRAQGATSLVDGSIDVLLHRRLLWDDAFGVKEPLNEHQYGTGLIATGKLHMLFGSKKSPFLVARERFLQNQMLMPNWLFFSNIKDTYEDWLRMYRNIVSVIVLG